MEGNWIVVIILYSEFYKNYASFLGFMWTMYLTLWINDVRNVYDVPEDMKYIL